MGFSCFMYFHIPLDGFHADGTDRRDHMVIVFPVGTADQRGAHSCNSFDLVITGIYILDDFFCGQAVVVGMILAVIHDLMTCVVEGLNGLRIFVHPIPHHEEGCFHVMLCQSVDELLSIFIPPCGIETDGDHIVIAVHAVDGQLPSGNRSGNTCRRVNHPEDS